MYEEKNKSGFVIGLLVGIIIILLVLVVLLLTNTISFNSNNSHENNNEVENGNQRENDNQNDNTSIDKELLNNLYDALGIPSDNNENGNTELSYFISRNDYKKYAHDIIVYSTVNSFGKVDGVELPDNYDISKDTGACSEAISCAIVSEEKANQLLSLYNFGGLISDYFHKSSVLENMYGIHFGGTLVMSEWNGPDAGITHQVNSEMVDGIIKIIDNQTISYYDTNNQNKLNTVNQTVTFEFNYGLDDYFLSSVSAK